ncbi:MAG: enoyl-CoA hydratase [Rhodospirillales bacterium]|nr:enoyl-CoA hydratase [Rhodospirillales bacterium]
MNNTILVERHNNIAFITLNRPEKRNALRQIDWILLANTIDKVSHEEELRCLVIRGAGDAAFCAGADISGFEEERSSREKVKAYEEATGKAFSAAYECRLPVIAMINGFCLGGGLELALACDLRISSPSGRFGIPAKNVGLFLSYGLLELLVDAVGKPTAFEILLEGRIHSAEEAKCNKLITRIADQDKLLEEVMTSAKRIAAGAPLAARWHRRAIRRLVQRSSYTSDELEAQYDYADSDDYKEGYQAFLNGKKPVFTGQ